MTSVSCVVPYYDDKGSLKATIESLLSQSIELSQIILVNDGCRRSDQNFEAIERITRRFSGDLLWVCHMENQGVSAARNYGLEFCNTELIAFCDADEIWHPQKNEFQISIFKESPSSEVVCFDDFSSDVVESIDVEDCQPRASDLGMRDFIFKNPVILSTVCCRGEIDIYFDERLKVAEDLSLWLHLVLRRKTLIRKYSIGLVCPSFGRYRTSGLSSSSTDMLKSLLSVYLELLRDKQIRFGDRIPVFLGLSIVVPRVFAITFYRMCRELLK